jgi:glutaredoxin
LGLSVDSVPCLQAWADSLGGISYPLLSDFYPHGETAAAFGVLRPEGYTERAIFVIDKKGIIRYMDIHDIDDQPDNEELFDVLASLETVLASFVEPQTTQPEPEPETEVIMYCTPWCSDCKKARAYLIGKGVTFTEIDISRNREAGQKVREWSGGYQITPSFYVKGEVVLDFDRERLDELLK